MTVPFYRNVWNKYAPSRNYCFPFICIVLLCLASILRLSHLGDKDFGFDEVLHVYVAQELVQGNPPVLPSGYVYDRGLSFSYLVGLAGFLGGFSEFTLRIPSAVFGVLVMLFVYWATTRWFSASAGVVAAFLTTFSPMEVALSREVRMYTLFQFLYLLTIFLFYEGFETSSGQITSRERFYKARKWTVDRQIRPLFLLFSGGIFMLAWETHKLIQPGISGVLAYTLLMGGFGLLTKKLDFSVRMKYIGGSFLLILAGFVFYFLFPEKVQELIGTTQAVPPWYQERAGNWNYYRWQLLDEYPIIFGSLTVSLVFCFIKNLKLGLFLTLSFFVPVFLHSVFFPQKSYRYIFHVLPIMYIMAGVGFGSVFSFLWSEGLKLNAQEYVSEKVWKLLVVGFLGFAVLGMLLNMPWFMRTVKDFSNNFQSPHITDVQHHHWKNVMEYISSHQKEGDVIISSYPLLSSYYGETQTLYFMNDTYDSNNKHANIRNEHGDLLDYTYGAIVLRTLENFKEVVKANPSGWIVTYRWRDERYWNHEDRPIPIDGSLPKEVVQYLRENYQLEDVPNSNDMALWRWNHEKVSESNAVTKNNELTALISPKATMDRNDCCKGP